MTIQSEMMEVLSVDVWLYILDGSVYRMMLVKFKEIERVIEEWIIISIGNLDLWLDRLDKIKL